MGMEEFGRNDVEKSDLSTTELSGGEVLTSEMRAELLAKTSAELNMDIDRVAKVLGTIVTLKPGYGPKGWLVVTMEDKGAKIRLITGSDGGVDSVSFNSKKVLDRDLMGKLVNRYGRINELSRKMGEDTKESAIYQRGEIEALFE